MKLTENYGLKKPDPTDVVNVYDFNYNADIIDSKLKEAEENLSSLELVASNVKMADGSNVEETVANINEELNKLENIELDGYATIEYVDVKDGEIKDILDNMFEEYDEEQISVDFPNASTISIVDNDDLFTSTTIEGALRELANNSGSGNAEGIKFDNSSNEMTSVNVQDAIEENKTSILNIENELSKSENTSYTTANGIKEFECKNGYVDNIVIEGETLVNLYPIDSSISVWDSNKLANDLRVLLMDRVSNGKFTVANCTNKVICVDIGVAESGSWKRVERIGVNSSKVIEISQSECILNHHGLFVDGWEDTDASKTEFKKSIVILEGDHTDKPITYFEGLKSVGQGDKIEVLSLTDNLFSKDDFVVGSTNSIVGDKFEVDNKTNRITHRTPIPVQMYEYLAFDYADNVKAHLYELDSNDNILKTYGWSKYSYIRAITPNTKYIRVIFSYDDDRDMSLDDYDMIKPFLTNKQDKKQILTTLRSLPNGVKDTIEKRGNKYYKIKRCGEITLNGNENWVLSQNNTNCIKFDIQSYTSIKLAPNGLCDKFNWENGALVSDYEFIGGHGSSRMIRCSILKSKLSTQDLAGFKTWLASNPVTVVYELATPIIEELPNFNPQTFSDKTTLLLNSGAVQGEVSFEVTNSLGSELEVLKDKVSNLDNYVVDEEVYYPTLLNGWTDRYSSNPLKISKIGNIVIIEGNLYSGTVTAGTLVFTIPHRFRPKRNMFVTVCSRATKSLLGTFSIGSSGNIIIQDNGFGDASSSSGGIAFSYTYSLI